MLENKTILIISPQQWGKMRLTKHHYAVALAQKGNKVYFLNPPTSENFNIRPIAEQDNLYLINYCTFFPIKLRFRFRKVYDILMAIQVKKLINAIGHKIDIVWCFEPNLYANLNWFKADLKIYHPVDELFYDFQHKVGKNADFIFSVTHEILSNFKDFETKKKHIHHGISAAFAKQALAALNNTSIKSTTTIGYVGNLLRPDIDTVILQQVINENPTINFRFWGSYQSKQSNIGENNANKNFISFLQQQNNVILEGVVHPDELAEYIQQVDAFLICYDVQKDQSKGTNYHKIMEYLSTGKVVISNNVTTFQRHPELLIMVQERTHNKKLPVLFKKVLSNLKNHNSEEQMKARIDFALEHTYSNNINLIENVITAK